ncbi:hypothetical protein CKM354_001031400 [Cercospora kikuchii]|uniref:Uncharacterized protein n=1 Tax=Cercospora kikuchii TaxID=84275 RepID=A0A9P3CWR2_9PEZI|nr:uncharacterized protein CKM354_001031400 [Cercospora kikuchii]GIZ47215.1 hypothetical protein CKM354_001031400 [Cercospora kikuchii]
MHLLLSLLSLFTLSHQHQSQQLGIGFDFAPAYATSAISHPNGSNIALARVNGDDAWRALMTRICFDPNSHLGKPGSTATSASTTMVDMIRALVKASEDRLGHRILAATVSMPSREDGSRGGRPISDLVRESFSVVGLEYLPSVFSSFFGEPLLYPENSIMAAHDLGLCHPYNVSKNHCLGPPGRAERSKETYYLVGYYSDALEVIETSPTALAYEITPYPYTDHQLGESMRDRNPDEAFYWEQVRRILSMPLLKNIWKPTKVIVYGDRSNDTHLRQVIAEVLRAFLGEDEQPQWVSDNIDPVFAGAMGAAVFAKRQPFWKWEQSMSDVAPTYKIDL